MRQKKYVLLNNGDDPILTSMTGDIVHYLRLMISNTITITILELLDQPWGDAVNERHGVVIKEGVGTKGIM